MIALDIPPFASFPLQGLADHIPTSVSLQYKFSAYEPTSSWQVLLTLLPSPASLYTLYERIILGQPTIILGQNPSHVCATIEALLDLIRPVPFAGIVRPYLPMQSMSLGGDSSLFDPASSPKSFLLGITNPFLLQRMTNAPATANTAFILALNSSADKSNSSTRSRAPSVSSIRHRTSLTRRSSTTAASSAARIDVPGIALHTQQRPVPWLKPDRRFLADISQQQNGVDGATPSSLSQSVRRHFADLTARLLGPIDRFLATGPTSTGRRNDGKTTFPLPAFLSTLAQHGVAVPFVGQATLGRHRVRDEFYTSFCGSSNFTAWMDMRTEMERVTEAGLLSADGGNI